MYLFMSGLCIYVWAMELFVHGFLVRLAVFGQTLGYCYSLGVVVVVVVQKLTICNISTITEYISLKIGVCVYSLKSNPYYQGRQIKKNFFFQNYVPFSTWTFYPPSSTPQPNVGTHMRRSCFHCVVYLDVSGLHFHIGNTKCCSQIL